MKVSSKKIDYHKYNKHTCKNWFFKFNYNSCSLSLFTKNSLEGLKSYHQPNRESVKQLPLILHFLLWRIYNGGTRVGIVILFDNKSPAESINFTLKNVCDWGSSRPGWLLHRLVTATMKGIYMYTLKTVSMQIKEAITNKILFVN